MDDVTRPVTSPHSPDAPPAEPYGAVLLRDAPSAAGNPAPRNPSGGDVLVVDAARVDEVSIDGMCGVC